MTACCLSILNNFKGWRTPIEFTFLGLTIVALKHWVLFRNVQNCNEVLRTSIANWPPWQNWEISIVRSLKWATKSLRQGGRNRLTTAPESQLVFPVLLGGTLLNCIHINFLRFWINFFTMKELEYLSEILWDYCLDVYLSVCKRISLDYHYFMWIFTCKVTKKSQK